MSMSNLSNTSRLPNPILLKCFHIDVANYIFTAFSATNLFVLLPLLIITLSVVLQRWWQQYPAPASHSDCVIFNMAVIELLSLVAYIFFCVAYYTQVHDIMMVTSQLCFIFACGQITFHILSCLERYLAVVHPMTYMHPKRHTIKRISIVCSWVSNLAQVFLINDEDLNAIIKVYFTKQVICLIIMSYCSIAVLRVLRRPGVGREVKKRVDQRNQRAFNTILTIMIMLFLRFCGNLISISVFHSPVFSTTLRCLFIDSSFWFGFPSSLVLPLLFLYREGKLPSCWKKTGEQ